MIVGALIALIVWFVLLIAFNGGNVANLSSGCFAEAAVFAAVGALIAAAL